MPFGHCQVNIRTYRIRQYRDKVTITIPKPRGFLEFGKNKPTYYKEQKAKGGGYLIDVRKLPRKAIFTKVGQKA
jgi:hypothetical protein